MINKIQTIVCLLMFGLIVSACGQTPAAPTEAQAATEASTEAPATATIEEATATSEPVVDLSISPETLSQIRLLWSVNYPGDFESSSCLNIEQACPLPTNITGYTFSPDGNTLAVGVCLGMRTEDRSQSDVDFWGCTAEHAIILYDSKTGAERSRLVPAALALSLSYHPNGSILAAGLANGDIEFWDLSSEEPITLAAGENSEGVYRLGFTPDGNRLVSASGFQLTIWDFQSGQPLDTIDRVYGFGISPDSKSLATLVLGDVETIRVYDLADVSNSVDVALEGQFRPNVFHFNPLNGIMSSGGVGIDAVLVNFWDLANDELVGSIEFDEIFDETGILYDLGGPGFTPDGYFLISRDGQLTAAEAQPEATGLDETLWECGFVLLDVEANQIFYHSQPRLFSECEGPDNLYFILGSKPQVMSADGRFIAAEEGLGLLRVWGIDASLPAVPPACFGDC